MGKYKDMITMYDFDDYADEDPELTAWLPIGNPESFATEYCGDFGPPEYECQHEPIDVGFTHSKWVCKKCDIVLQSYEPENKKQ